MDLSERIKQARYDGAHITQELYAYLKRTQDNKCVICGMSPYGRELVIDHDHNTGVVRGLLCVTCNAGLGLFKDRVDLLEKAIHYLQSGTYEMPNELTKFDIKHQRECVVGSRYRSTQFL